MRAAIWEFYRDLKAYRCAPTAQRKADLEAELNRIGYRLQPLDIVLKNNSLDKQLDGNVLRLATKDTLKKEAEENRDLAKVVDPTVAAGSKFDAR